MNKPNLPKKPIGRQATHTLREGYYWARGKDASSEDYPWCVVQCLLGPGGAAYFYFPGDEQEYTLAELEVYPMMLTPPKELPK